MSDWRDGWTGNSRDGYGRGGAGPRPESARAMRQRGGGDGYGGYGGRYPSEPPMPPGMSPRRAAVPSQQSRGYDDYDDGYGQGQVYGDGYDDGPYDRRGGRGRRFKNIALTLIVVLLVVLIGTYFWADSKLRREVDLSKVDERPETGEGTTYLIVGSDSRDGLTAEDKKSLHTGSAAGKRTDSMIILHVGSNGNTMVSLPRDSWVTIPSFHGSESGKAFPARGGNKLNAAYSIDGAPLLVRTVEFNTGLHIDHYAEIGFGGFAKIVDAVGGVEMNIPRDIKDKDSGADFKKGTQTLNGEQALAFVRNRKEAGSDLERTKNQQKFLSALASQTANPGTVLNPFKLYPTMGAGLDTLVVDKEMSLFDLAEMFWAMKGVTGGEGKSMNMPIAGPAPAGSLKWDMTRVKQLVQQLKNDEPVTVQED
ncbi:LCP family protein [Streptomyces sp. KR80]|uniref:LCP family protein n=1 Tax=Streptomyces sp. KR80 TaxID=3457426 RepID=UPI003FD14890